MGRLGFVGQRGGGVKVDGEEVMEDSGARMV